MMFSGYNEPFVQAAYLAQPQDGSMGPFPVKYLPTCQPRSPWFVSAVCQLDFLLIAEFSEQEGPKPLITIPSDPGGKMDLNDFAVRIMSVDFQSVNNESFHLTEDTQVFLSETHNGIYAYVHHFTLYDCNARGFVRPFCMAYITPDQNKLISFAQEMSQEFFKVSRYLKYGNMLLFVKDMTHYLTDLQYTRERFIEKSQEQHTSNGKSDPTEDDIMKTMNLKTINLCIQDIKDILEKASSQLTDKDLETKFRQYEDKEKEEMVNLSSSYSSHGSPKISKFLRLSKSGSFSEAITPKNDLMYKPKLVRTLNRRRFDHVMRGLQDLCGYGAKEGLRRLNSVYRFYSRDVAILEAERQDSHLIVPAATMLTVGRLVKLNFVNSDLFDGQDIYMSKTSSLGTSLRRWLSDETLASLSSFDSLLQDEDGSQVEPAFVLGSSYLEHRGSCSSFDNSASDSCVESVGTSMSDDAILERRDSQCSLTRTISITSPADHVVSLSSATVGFGMLAFINQCAFAPHVMYSLLTGRTVVVLASSKAEREARVLVRTLMLLVPGHSCTSHAVIPWQTKPIKIADLSRVKLIGLCKPERRNGNLNLGSVRRYVSILDFDKKVYEGPAYKGDVLTTLYSKRKSFKSEKPFLALIHSTLMELALKSFVYYYSFCMKPPSGKSSWQDPGESHLQRCKSQAFLASLSLGTHDANIVRYFTDVVKRQQLEELGCLDVQDNPSCPTVSLRFETCGTFKA